MWQRRTLLYAQSGGYFAQVRKDSVARRTKLRQCPAGAVRGLGLVLGQGSAAGSPKGAKWPGSRNEGDVGDVLAAQGPEGNLIGLLSR